MSVLLVVLLAGVFVVTQQDDKELQMVHLLYRHGARAPIHFYPSDMYKKEIWPNGVGELTQVGMKMAYELGRFLRERYINSDFINKSYLRTEVYVRSSDVERCLQSAEVQLAGMFLPKRRQAWNTAIPWQPIPIHTTPRDKDYVLRTPFKCPRMKVLNQEKLVSKEYKQKQKENQEIFRVLSNYSGMEIHLGNIATIADTLLCEIAQGLEIPKWAVHYKKPIMELFEWRLNFDFKGDELGKLVGGTLLSMIVDNMMSYSEGKDIRSLHKLNIFSGHDSSILALASVLNLNISSPSFAACIMVELYKDKNGTYYVELTYRNNQKIHPVKLKGCELSCPLQTFLRLTSNHVSRKIDEECGITSQMTLVEGLKFVTPMFFASSVVLLVIMIVLCVKQKTTGWKVTIRRSRSLHIEEEEEEKLMDTVI